MCVLFSNERSFIIRKEKRRKGKERVATREMNADEVFLRLSRGKAKGKVRSLSTVHQRSPHRLLVPRCSHLNRDEDIQQSQSKKSHEPFCKALGLLSLTSTLFVSNVTLTSSGPDFRRSVVGSDPRGMSAVDVAISTPPSTSCKELA